MIEIFKNKKIFPATVILFGILFFAAITHSFTSYNAGCSVSGCNLPPINEGGEAQYKVGPLAFGKASNPVSLASLDVNGTIDTSSLLSFGNIVVGSPSNANLGNYKADNIKIDSLSSNGKRTVCTDQNGLLKACEGSVNLTVDNPVVTDLGGTRVLSWSYVDPSGTCSPYNVGFNTSWTTSSSAANGSQSITVPASLPWGSTKTYGITCSGSQGNTTASVTITVSNTSPWIRDTEGAYTFSTNSLPSNVTSYTIEIWGGGGPSFTTSNVCNSSGNVLYSIGSINPTLGCGTGTTITGGGYSMAANAGAKGTRDLGGAGGTATFSGSQPLQITNVTGGYGTTKRKRDSSFIGDPEFITINNGNYDYCVGGDGGLSAGIYTYLSNQGGGDLNSSGQVSYSSALGTAPYFVLHPYVSALYGLGTGGVGITGPMTSPPNYNCTNGVYDEATGGGGGGGYLKVTLSKGSNITYTINVGRAGYFGLDYAGKGAVKITW